MFAIAALKGSNAPPRLMMDSSATWMFVLSPSPMYGTSSRSTFSIRVRSEEHTSELQSQSNLVCRLLLEKKKQIITHLLASTLPSDQPGSHACHFPVTLSCRHCSVCRHAIPSPR